MPENTFKVALAGLLHDIGKFAQRAGQEGKHTVVGQRVIESNFKSLWPPGWSDDIGDAVAGHHGTDTPKNIVKAVQVADWLTSARGEQGDSAQGDPKNSLLIPIAAKVALDKEGMEANWRLPLKSLNVSSLDEPVEKDDEAYPPIFPKQNLTISLEDYENLWQALGGELQTLPGPINSFSRFTGLMSLLRCYTAQMPSGTPGEDEEADRGEPDVSLYDHLKVTAAIAPCLLQLPPDDLDALHALGWQPVMDDTRPVACLLRADISGIQAFIYRITTPEREREHRSTAKRLRGRSFYISLLSELVVDWFLRQLELTAANALFVGGGRFDLLIPAGQTTESRLEALENDLQAWLVKEFHGILGLEMAVEDLTPPDFKNLQRANIALDDKLAQAKRQKLRQALSEDFFSVQQLDRVCAVCSLTPLAKEAPPGERICDLCELHKQIGQQLPKTTYIARLYGSKRAEVMKKTQGQAIDFAAPLNIGVALLPNESAVRSFVENAGQLGLESILYSLNDVPSPGLTWPDKAAPAQLYLANAAPRRGDKVYEFDDIAELSVGSKLLGVLKADVDHLGLVFSLGLEPPTISRTAALSHAFDRFFSGYLNTLCRSQTEKWKREQRQADQQPPEDLDSLFYIVYAGGDDLLIIGPWDQTVELARQLNADFRAYTCHNPNITLSAGITLVKPHFPIQRFVELTGEALDGAKDAGRDRFTIFEETPVRWTYDGSPTAFDELLKLAHKLREKVESKQMPRTLIHDMEQMRRIEYKSRDGSLKPMITPQLLYLLTRRLPKEVRDELQKAILDAWPGIRIPASYVSLSTRKE